MNKLLILVLIKLTTSEELDEPVHPYSVARSLTVRKIIVSDYKVVNFGTTTKIITGLRVTKRK